jgi:quercetin dioxygenase-like cupin family protein
LASDSTELTVGTAAEEGPAGPPVGAQNAGCSGKPFPKPDGASIIRPRGHGDRGEAHMKAQTRFVTGHVTLALLFLAAAGVAVVATGGGNMLHAQTPGFKRVELQRHELSTAGREVVMTRGEFNAGAGTPKHTHPGEEVAYILEGQLTVEIEGKPPTILKAGDVFFIPGGQIHSAKNTGTTVAKAVSTYIVEKGKPLATPVK